MLHHGATPSSCWNKDTGVHSKQTGRSYLTPGLVYAHTVTLTHTVIVLFAKKTINTGAK